MFIYLLIHLFIFCYLFIYLFFIYSFIHLFLFFTHLFTYLFIYLFTLYLYSAGQNDQNTYFQQLKNDFKSVISIFCCSVSVGNISLRFQTFILSLIVIIQRSDLIIISLSEWHEETEQTETKSRRTVSQDASRTSCKAPEKLCSSAPRTKAALNTKMLTTNVDFI